MKKIIFMAILSTLLLQGCKTADKSTAAAAPAVEAKKDAKPIELDPVKIMSNSNIGNCLACHAIPGKPEMIAGNMGPPFIGMKDRFPDIAVLREAISDQKKFQAQTLMPPFGRNKIMTPEQIDAVAQYIYQF